jgi:hypothetical protein
MALEGGAASEFHRDHRALRAAPREQPTTDDRRERGACRHLKGPLPDPKAHQRLGMFLVRRGFAPGTARRAILAAIAESTGTESTAGGGGSDPVED